jgi:hypothetical protein
MGEIIRCSASPVVMRRVCVMMTGYQNAVDSSVGDRYAIALSGSPTW